MNNGKWIMKNSGLQRSRFDLELKKTGAAVSEIFHFSLFIFHSKTRGFHHA